MDIQCIGRGVPDHEPMIMSTVSRDGCLTVPEVMAE